MILHSKASHPTKLIIAYEAVQNNIAVYRNAVTNGTKIMLMIKAQAYGNGDIMLAKYLEKHRLIDYLGVAYVSEGIALREEGIMLPIMVMNTGVLDLEEVLAYNLEPSIYNPDQLAQLIQLNPNDIRRIRAHFKINTGMNRLGFSAGEIGQAALKLVEYGVDVVGAYTHLASSPEVYHDDFTRQQIAAFNRGYEILQEKIGYRPMRHILNSAGILRFPEFQFEMVRAGMGIYGIDPSETQQDKFMSISTWLTKISQINTLNTSDTVGYVRRGKIEHNGSRIAVLPVGYADGYNRLWSNGKAKVYINGAYAPTVGNVCMDMTFVDVTGITCSVGDEVELMGAHIDIQDLAKAAETIDYEVLTSIGPRVVREYV